MNEYADDLQHAFDDRYPIVRPLGAGGMATVYLARDLKHGREVAVKVLRPELTKTIGADRFLREIEIAARLTHPHILPLHDSGEVDGFLYYVMPYVDGESLRHRLTREPQLPLVEALRIAREVADALSYAHANHVVHRDVKPENILNHAGHVLVADFGIARAMTLSTVESLTRAGVAIGTPAYMSPEQVGGEPNIDGRSDIYSLGCVLYEMLAGKPPFTGPTPDNICRQHVSGALPAMTPIRPLVPPRVADIIDEAMAKRPADRYATAETLVEDLSLQESLATDPSTRASRRMRIARRRISIVSTLAGVGAFALFASALGLLQRGSEPTARTVATHHQVTFVGNVAEAAVSPQGNFLAYTTTGPAGATLMVQDLESGSSIEIASSPDPIVFPSWSPDGQEILVGGGTAGEYTHLVYPRLGGDPYSLPPAGGALAKWSVDGRQKYSWGTDTRNVTFSTIATGSHMRVPVADTTAWLQDVAQHPRGDVLATLHAARDGPTNSIWRVSIDSTQRFEKTAPGDVGRINAGPYELMLQEEARLFSFMWSPTGDAFYYLRQDENSYQLRKFLTDQGRTSRDSSELLVSGLELAGKPYGPWLSLLSLTADGSRLFYVKGRTFSNLWSLQRRGDEWDLEPLTTGTATNYAVSVSPDGQWVAYNSMIGARTNVFVAPSEGGPPRQLTHVDSVSGYPVWSPDGQSLAFGLRRRGGNHVAIISVSSAPAIKVFESTELSGNGTITWAPGSEILYQRPDLRNFHFLDADTGAERPLFSADSASVAYALQIRYSPDRTQVAVSLNRNPRDEAGLYVMSLGDGARRRVTPQPDVSPLGWSRDGRTVYALWRDQRTVIAVPAGGGRPTVLETLPFEANWVGTTYYGRWFVFAAVDATGDVWSIENFDPG